MTMDSEGVEPSTLACKASVFPLTLTAHIGWESETLV